MKKAQDVRSPTSLATHVSSAFLSVGYVSLTPKFLITLRCRYFSSCVPDFSPSSFQTTQRVSFLELRRCAT